MLTMSSPERNPDIPLGGTVQIPGWIGNSGVNSNVGNIGGLPGDHKRTLTLNLTTDTSIMHLQTTAL